MVGLLFEVIDPGAAGEFPLSRKTPGVSESKPSLTVISKGWDKDTIYGPNRKCNRARRDQFSLENLLPRKGILLNPSSIIHDRFFHNLCNSSQLETLNLKNLHPTGSKDFLKRLPWALKFLPNLRTLVIPSEGGILSFNKWDGNLQDLINLFNVSCRKSLEVYWRDFKGDAKQKYPPLNALVALKDGSLSLSQFNLVIKDKFDLNPNVSKQILNFGKNPKLRDLSITLPTFEIELLKNIKFSPQLKKLSIKVTTSDLQLSKSEMLNSKPYSFAPIFSNAKKPWKFGAFSDFRGHPDLEKYGLRDIIAHLEQKTSLKTQISLSIPRGPLFTTGEALALLFMCEHLNFFTDDVGKVLYGLYAVHMLYHALFSSPR